MLSGFMCLGGSLSEPSLWVRRRSYDRVDPAGGWVLVDDQIAGTMGKNDYLIIYSVPAPWFPRTAAFLEFLFFNFFFYLAPFPTRLLALSSFFPFLFWFIWLRAILLLFGFIRHRRGLDASAGFYRVKQRNPKGQTTTGSVWSDQQNDLTQQTQQVRRSTL